MLAAGVTGGQLCMQGKQGKWIFFSYRTTGQFGEFFWILLLLF